MRIWIYIGATLALCAAVYAAQAILTDPPGATERLASPYEAERETARRELLAQGPAAFEKLASLLDSQNYRQRKLAAEVIAEIANEAHADALIDLLAKFPDRPEVTPPLLEATTRLAAKKAIPQIRNLLAGHDAQIRAAAADALATLGDTASAAEIAALLKDDYSEARSAAANALAKLQARDRAAAIYAALQGERAQSAKIAQIAALGDLQYAPAGSYLIDLLRDADSPLFLPTVLALAAMRTDSARDALIALLMGAEDFETLGVAAKAVAAYGESAINVLNAKLKTASTDDRRRILEAFEQMGQEVVPHLIAFLETETYPLWQSRTDGILREKVKKYYGVDVDWELRHHDPPAKRALAVKRWRQWWDEFSKDKN